MAEQRRSLVEGLSKPEAERAKEESFVFGTKAEPTPEPVPAAPEPQSANWQAGRVPLTTRIRPDLGERLKRLSLNRQLSGKQPSAIQDIIEEALQLWFLKNDTQP